VLVITTALVVLYAFVTTRTVIGRQIYAVGGNAKAAKLSVCVPKTLSELMR
jgi:putative multiple sugar transport system permease protein